MVTTPREAPPFEDEDRARVTDTTEWKSDEDLAAESGSDPVRRPLKAGISAGAEVEADTFTAAEFNESVARDDDMEARAAMAAKLCFAVLCSALWLVGNPFLPSGPAGGYCASSHCPKARPLLVGSAVSRRASLLR